MFSVILIIIIIIINRYLDLQAKLLQRGAQNFRVLVVSQAVRTKFREKMEAMTRLNPMRIKTDISWGKISYSETNLLTVN